MLLGFDIFLFFCLPYNDCISLKPFQSLPESRASVSLGARPERGITRPPRPWQAVMMCEGPVVRALLSITGAAEPVPDGPPPPLPAGWTSLSLRASGEMVPNPFPRERPWL